MIGEGSGRHVNELLRDQLIFFLEEIGVEAHSSPGDCQVLQSWNHAPLELR